MGLRTKNLLVVGTVMAGLLIVATLVSSGIFVRSVQSMESRKLNTDAARVAISLSAELDRLNTVAIDWAQWDDTYAFAVDHNAAYVTANLNATITQLKVNLILIYDAQGRYVQRGSR